MVKDKDLEKNTVSRTQLKLEAEKLQSIGLKLCDLSTSKLKALDLPPNLLEAILAMQKITSNGAADQLISASSTVSDDVQLHTMMMDGNVMRMREVKQIDVPANGAVELKPGGLHLMFMNIKAPLKAGELVPVKLKFAKAGEVEVKMPVNAPGSQGHGPKH